MARDAVWLARAWRVEPDPRGARSPFQSRDARKPGNQGGLPALTPRILYDTYQFRMNAARLTEIPVVFYRTSGGAEPVLDWLRGLPAQDRRTIGADLATVQFGWPIGMPLVRSLKDGLWEVRSALPSQRIARLLLCFHEETLIVLHGFIKKTQKTAPDDLALAKRRMNEVTR